MSLELFSDRFIDDIANDLGFNPQDITATIAVETRAKKGRKDPVCKVNIINTTDEYRLVYIETIISGDSSETRVTMLPGESRIESFDIPEKYETEDEVEFVTIVRDCFDREIASSSAVVLCGTKAELPSIQAKAEVYESVEWDGLSPIEVGNVVASTETGESRTIFAEVLINGSSVLAYTIDASKQTKRPIHILPSMFKGENKINLTIMVHDGDNEVTRKTGCVAIRKEKSQSINPSIPSDVQIRMEFRPSTNKAIDVHQTDSDGNIRLGTITLTNVSKQREMSSVCLFISGNKVKQEQVTLSSGEKLQMPVVSSAKALYGPELHNSQMKILLQDMKGSCIIDYPYTFTVRSKYDVNLKDKETMWVKFINPRSKVVNDILDKMGHDMRISNTGYMSESNILSLIEMAYSAAQSMDVVYSNSANPYIEEDSYYQRVRSVDEIYRKKGGNCIEMSLALASFIEHLGLEPVIIEIPHHAMAGIIVSSTAEGRSYKMPTEVAADISKEYGHSLIDYKTGNGSFKILPIESTLCVRGQRFKGAVQCAIETINETPNDEIKIVDVFGYRHEKKINPILME